MSSGIVRIHGREYKTVALRVSEFRQSFAGHSLVTEIVSADDPVIMRATISDESGRVIATGHAEELRGSSQINRTSALENAETSAIGRALAAFGLGGSEFASADEVANAIRKSPGADEAARLSKMRRELGARLVKEFGGADEVTDWLSDNGLPSVRTATEGDIMQISAMLEAV